MSDETRNYGSSCESHKAAVQAWWNEARKSAQPPLIPAFLAHMIGMPWNVGGIPSFCWDSLRAAAEKKRYGTFAYLIQQFASGHTDNMSYNLKGSITRVFADAHTKSNEAKPSEDDLWVILKALNYSVDNTKTPPWRFLCILKTMDDIVTLRRNYSDDLVKIILHNSSFSVPKDFCQGTFRDPSHKDNGLVLLESVLPLMTECRVADSVKWQEDVLHGFIRILAKCQKLGNMKIPGIPVKETRGTKIIPAGASVESPSVCGVRELRIGRYEDCSKTERSPCSYSFPFLEFATWHMPKLENLSIVSVLLPQEWIPNVVDLMSRNDSQLRQLCISDCRYYYERETGSSNIIWLPIFHALKTNKSLRRFWFLNNTLHNDDIPCKTAMRDVMKHYNTTLTDASYSSIIGKGVCDEVRYYADLNRCGRAKARDPCTSLREWMDMLVVVAQKQDTMLYPERCVTINRIYGLLRDSPSVVADYLGYLENKGSRGRATIAKETND